MDERSDLPLEAGVRVLLTLGSYVEQSELVEDESSMTDSEESSSFVSYRGLLWRWFLFWCQNICESKLLILLSP